MPVVRVLSPGDGENAKLTPRAHYNNYTAKERAEIGKYTAENRPTNLLDASQNVLGKDWSSTSSMCEVVVERVSGSRAM